MATDSSLWRECRQHDFFCLLLPNFPWLSYKLTLLKLSNHQFPLSRSFSFTIRLYPSQLLEVNFSAFCLYIKRYWFLKKKKSELLSALHFLCMENQKGRIRTLCWVVNYYSVTALCELSLFGCWKREAREFKLLIEWLGFCFCLMVNFLGNHSRLVRVVIIVCGFDWSFL